MDSDMVIIGAAAVLLLWYMSSASSAVTPVTTTKPTATGVSAPTVSPIVVAKGPSLDVQSLVEGDTIPLYTGGEGDTGHSVKFLM